MSSVVENSQMQTTNKVAMPLRLRTQPSVPVVERAELLQALGGKQLIWLNAHAGFGKTQLMLQLATLHEQQAGQVVWLTVNKELEQEHNFIAALIAGSLQQLTLDQEGENLLAAAQEFNLQDIEQALLHWLSCLIQHKQNVLVCLDDVHLLGAGQSWQLLVRMFELMPSHCRVLVAGRYLPAATGRLRLLSRLVWQDATNLRYTDTEVQALIEQLELADKTSQIQDHIAFLQGWPAGLSIWLEQFKRLSPHVITTHFAQLELEDYLMGEVMRTVPSELHRFLCELAVIGNFDEALLHNHYGNSQYHALLMQALKLNLFLQPLLKTPGWYQMHPVLAALLAKQLPLAERQAIHRQAFSWLSKQPNQAIAALRHALAADMAMQVQDWVLEKSESILASQDFSSLLTWVAQLEGEFLQKTPRLLAIACWTYVLTQKREQAYTGFEQLQRYKYLQPVEEVALQAILARLDNNIERSLPLCEQAFKEMPVERFALRVLMASTLTHLNLSKHKIEEAYYWNKQTKIIAQQNQSTNLEALALFDNLRIEFHRGRINDCKELVEQAVKPLLQTPEGLSQIPAGRLIAYQAMLGWLTGEDEAKTRVILEQGIRLCQQQHDVSLSLGYALKAVLLANEKEYEAALQVLSDAKIQLQQWQVEPFNYQWLSIVQINILLSQNKLGLAQRLLNDLLGDKGFALLPKPEVFPLLPELTMLTQARLYLLTGQTDTCLELIETARNQSENAIFQHLLGLLKAVSLQRFGGVESQQLLNSMMRILQHEKISIKIFNWLPLKKKLLADDDKDTKLNTNLSERELEVLQKIAEGLSNQEIADQLFISLHTVKTHARKINIKLAAKNRTQALCRARELALI